MPSILLTELTAQQLPPDKQQEVSQGIGDLKFLKDFIKSHHKPVTLRRLKPNSFSVETKHARYEYTSFAAYISKRNVETNHLIFYQVT